MLKNTPPHIAVLALIVNSPFEFHLTGSQFFKHATPSSDWDFFVDCSGLGGEHALQDWLVRNDFTPVIPVQYAGIEAIKQIWEHRNLPIHIQVVDDAATKAKVQDLLASSSFVVGFRKMSKSDRSLVWKIAEASFEAGERFALQSAPAELAEA